MSVEVVTFGCRLNTYESEVIRRNAEAAGLAETVVVNTCAVTGEAVRQARQAIRRLRRERPDARILVTGCAAQTEPETFAAMREVDRVIGNDGKMRADAWRETRDFLARDAFDLGAEEKIAVNDIMAIRETAAHLIDGLDGRARAFVEVQNGCDHRCTFCIIPYGRGNSRSVPMGEVVTQIRRLVDNGFREVVLTGVDLTSYGGNLPGAPRLGTLVKQILKRMKRRHLRADAIAFCDQVRSLRPDVVFGGDIIAGFPTETEEMFARSLDLVSDCGLTFLHVFPFSARPGTPAARMPQVRREIAKERARRLRQKGETALAAHLAAQVGTRRRVLAETRASGRT